MATTITPGATPIPFSYGGHSYWLMPDGRWANSANGTGQVPQSAIAAILAGQGVQGSPLPAGGGQGGGSGGSTGGTGGGIAGSSAPGGAQVTGIGINYQQPTADPYNFGDRFGPANLQPYGYQIYAPPGTPGTPAAGGGTGTGSTGGSGTGSAGGGSTGGGSTGGGSTGGSGGSGSGTGSSSGGRGGNAGNTGTGSDNPSGGMHGGNDRGGFGGLLGLGGGAGNGAGGGAGSGGAGSGGAGSGGAGGGIFGPASPQDYISMGLPAQIALSLASQLPGVYGLPATVAGLAMHGYNTATSDSLNSGLGLGGLDVGQVLGGVLGLNRYGSLSDPQIANRDAVSAKTGGQLNAGISPGGVYDPGMIARVFGDTLQTEYTPDEYARRQYALQHQSTMSQQGTPITRADGTVIGYMKPDGTSTTAAGQAAINNNSVSGGTALGIGGTPNSPATTAAMGGGWNGRSSNGGGIGSGTGINGGGQADRAGFRRGGMIPGRPDAIPDNRTIRADEGEFVVRRAAARKLGPALLGLVNDPRKAPQVRAALLGLGGRR
jgi:hypothetical protein